MCAVLFVMVALSSVMLLLTTALSEYARASFKEVKLLNPRAKIFLPLEMDDDLVIVGPPQYVQPNTTLSTVL